MAETKLIRDHHLLTRNLKLNNNYISNDGGDEGITVDDAGDVGVGIPTTITPSTKLEVFNSNVQYSTGTAYQSSTAIVGTGTTFTTAMVGGRFIFDDGTDAGTITQFNNTVILIVSTSQTVGASDDLRSYKIYYPAVQIDTGASSTSLKIGNISISKDEIDLSTAGDITIDAVEDIILSADGGNITMNDGTVSIFNFNVDEPTFTIYDDADTDGARDSFDISVAADGKTFFRTSDDSGGLGAHLIIDPEGYVQFKGLYLYLTPDTKTASGTDDASFLMGETLDLPSGAGGNDNHFGVYYAQTQTNLAGWDNVYLMYLTGGGDIFSIDKDALLSITTTGTAKSITDVLTITNDVNAADMDGTGSAIKFNQWYYDGSSPAIEDAAKIAIATETDWTSTASTRDSYMAFSTSLDGTLAEKLRITSAGNVGIGEAAPQDTLEVNGTILVKDALKFTQNDGNEFIDSQNDGYLDIGATTGIRLEAPTLCEDKLYFTQTDGNEFIDSQNDGYLDIGATTGIRLEAPTLCEDKLEVEQGASGGGTAFIIDNNDTDQIAMSIEAANIDADVIDITANTLTTSYILDIAAAGLTDGRILDSTSTSTVTDGGSSSLFNIFATNDGVGSQVSRGLYLDYNKSAITADTKTANVWGLVIDMDDSVTNVGTVSMRGMAIDVDFANAGDGTTTATGLNVACAGADNNYAIITGGGNVGIGVAAPDQMLEVNGGVHINDTAYFTTPGTVTGNGTTSIDWRTGNKYHLTFAASTNETITFANNPSGACNLILKLKQPASGAGCTANWTMSAGTLYWVGGGTDETGEPTLSTGVNDVDIISFYFDGTNYYGVASLGFDA